MLNEFVEQYTRTDFPPSPKGQKSLSRSCGAGFCKDWAGALVLDDHELFQTVQGVCAKEFLA